MIIRETRGTTGEGALTRADVLVVDNLQRRFGDLLAVDDVSFHIAPGETFGLLGPNGAGKTTTISMVAGLIPADGGTVTVAGEPMIPGSVDPKRHIGLVPQDLAIYPELTARENLTFFGKLQGMRGSTLKARTAEVLELIGLTDRAKDATKEYSGGMKRRLNIGIGLLHRPALLILDEPTVGVDPQSRNAIFDNLETLRERGKALLYTTHYMEEAERLCDRVVIMDHGKVVASDTLAGLYRRLPAVETLDLEIDGTVDLAALAGETPVTKPTQDGTRLHAGVADLGCAAPALLAWLAARGHAVHRISSGRADLEDVFLALTGRQLRD